MRKTTYHKIFCVILFGSLILSSLFFASDVSPASARVILKPAIATDSDPSLGWYTFLGASALYHDVGEVIADSSGNIYLSGKSSEEWGDPVRGHSGGTDAFVAKLANNGELLWLTFLGDDLKDDSSGITVDANGNVYIIGTSNGSWGRPLNPFYGLSEAFVAKLNTNGNSLWNTFMGGFNKFDDGFDLVLDIYRIGHTRSMVTW